MNKRLKKYSPVYLMVNICYAFVLPLLVLYGVELAFMGMDIKVLFSFSYILLNTILSAFIALLYFLCRFSWGDSQMRIMKRTEKAYVKGNFQYTESYYGSHAFIYLNIADGKLGVIMEGNPHVFQIVDGRNIEKFWVDNHIVSKKLSKGVRFCIKLDGITIVFDTFVTNTTFFMESPRVIDGLNKAQYYCDCLERLRQNAHDSVNINYLNTYEEV